jgi:hypothetical protein
LLKIMMFDYLGSGKYIILILCILDKCNIRAIQIHLNV